MIVTAMVSPSARPRPSMEAEMTPALPNGSTAVRIISHWVAPRASAPSLWVTGVCANTSRDSAVTIGSTMIARTMPTKQDRAAAADARVGEQRESSRACP